jgi:transmembrane sensor
MQDKHILKYIKGELDAFEKRQIINWIKSSPGNQKKFNLLKAKYISSTFSDVSNTDHSLHYRAFVQKLTRKPKLKYTAIAASIIILLLLTLGYHYNSEIIVNQNNDSKELMANTMINTITSKGVKSEVVLPDGSLVVLNVDSKLTYPKTFNDTIRIVSLIGEAFFDIQHDSTRPFIVDVNEIQIKVLGTTFNVKSYSEDQKIETTLLTGKVEVLKDNETPILLEPSQKAVFDKLEHKLQIEEVNSTNIIAWKNGKLVFKNTALRDIAIDLERKYNKKIIINSKHLQDYEYTGTFDNLTINEILNLLAISSPIKYVINDEEIILELK